MKKKPQFQITLTEAILIVLLLFVLYSIFYWTSDTADSPKFRDYASLVVQLGGVISLVVLLFEISQKETSRQNVEARNFALQTENSFIELEEEFQNWYPYLNRLYRSMNPQFAHEFEDLPPPEVDLAKDKILEIHMANVIFQKIENVLMENIHADFTRGKESEWLTTWRT